MNHYETIHLEDYFQSGEGGTAVSYTHKTRPSLAKLYNPGFEAERAVEEFRTARTVFEMGIPTPEPYRLVTDGVRYGAEYELVPGKRSFTRIISQEPERLEEMSRTFAREAKALHAIPADTTRLRSYKQAMKRFYEEKDLVPADFKRRALAFLESVPESPTCLHGDLHIGNIITDGKRTLWIDVGEFSYGVPEWDHPLDHDPEYGQGQVGESFPCLARDPEGALGVLPSGLPGYGRRAGAGRFHQAALPLLCGQGALCL